MILKIEKTTLKTLINLINTKTKSLFILPHLTTTKTNILNLPNCTLHLSTISGFFPHHQITHTPYNLNIMKKHQIITQLTPQPRNININTPIQTIIIVLKQHLIDILTTHNTPNFRHQKPQQIELNHYKINLHTTNLHLPSTNIDHKISK